MLFLDEAKIKGLAAPSNLSMNQTLEGHSGKSPWAFNVFWLEWKIQNFGKLVE